MPIETGVPSSLARPQTFHRFSYLRGGGQLVPLQQKVALMGTMYDPDTVEGEPGQVYEINSAEQADKLFGTGSELALMVRQAYGTQRVLGRGPRIVAIGVEAPTGGGAAAATFTLTVTGTATESGNLVLKASGRRFKVGVVEGDDATDVAESIVEMLSRSVDELAFTVDNAAGIVTATYNHTGENGDDLVFEVESMPAGIAVAVAVGVAGVGVLDLSTAYTAIEGIDIDGFVVSNHTADDVEDYVDHVTAMWQPSEKRWRWGFMADTTSLASATTLAQAANDRAIVVVSMEGSPSLPFEIATSVAVAAFSRTRPNATFNKMELPVYPPAQADAYNGSEVETGIAAGLTILTPIERGRVVVGDRSKIERLVTTKTTENAQPFLQCRDIGVPRTGAYLARQLDIKYEERFGPNANPDGVLMDDLADDRIRDMVAALWHDAAAVSYIKNVDADLAELLVETDEEVPERFNVQTAMTVVLGLHQVAYAHNVKVGG
jgi:phage tail sheath gpL-like